MLDLLNKEEKPKFANTNEVVMEKAKLIETLVENKAKHDMLYEVSVKGYFELAKERLEEKKQKLDESIKELKEDINVSLTRAEKKLENKELLPAAVFYRGLQWDNALNLTFPENHTKDYERVIRMMQMSIYETVHLTVHEFDAYVLNNWEWKDKFVSSNTQYVMKARSSPSNFSLINVSGSLASFPAGSGYNQYANNYIQYLTTGNITI